MRIIYILKKTFFKFNFIYISVAIHKKFKIQQEDHPTSTLLRNTPFILKKRIYVFVRLMLSLVKLKNNIDEREKERVPLYNRWNIIYYFGKMDRFVWSRLNELVYPYKKSIPVLYSLFFHTLTIIQIAETKVLWFDW